MTRHILATGLAAIAATVTLVTTSSSAHASRWAGPLSRGATELLEITPGTDSYLTKYDQVSDLYIEQAQGDSLGFDDWFAINSFVNNERAAYGTDGATLQDLKALDLSQLTWEAGAHGVEVFFINEGAGYKNDFGYSTTPITDVLPQRPVDMNPGVKPTPPEGYRRWPVPKLEDFDGNQAEFDAVMAERGAYEQALKAYYEPLNAPLGTYWDSQVTKIWNDIGSDDSIFANGGTTRLGERQSLGSVNAGDTLNFFLRNPNNRIYNGGVVFDSGTQATTFNGDGLQHVTTYQYKDLLVLAYEDLYNGGDRDYNDVVIAVRGLTDTSPDVADVPEPASALALLGLGVAGAVVKRQRAQ